MFSQIAVLTLVLLLRARCISAYPVHPESSSAQDLMPTDFSVADGAADFMAGSKPLAGLQEPRNVNQVLFALGEGASHHQKAASSKGNKSTPQEDVPSHLVEDLDAVLWKMVAVDELQRQGFTQTYQAPQQPSKRTCFWKYCVNK